MTPEIIERFKSRLTKTDSCWLFNGKLDKYGNGRCAWIPYKLNPKGNKMRLVHHIAWMVFKGEEVPKKVDILHSCLNQHCCNPDHLYIGKRGQSKVRPHANRVPIEDRFWLKVDKKGEDECWPWTGWTNNKNGTATPSANHGRVRYKGRNCVSSRVAWILTHGEIPDELFVCHHCDNPPCCNPKHLFLGTPRDNLMDCIRKGRLNSRRGERINTAKLTEKDVIEMRAEYKSNPTDSFYKCYALRFGVLPDTIFKAVNKLTWKHLD